MLKKVLAIATIVGILGFGGMEVEAATHPHHGHAPGFHNRAHVHKPGGHIHKPGGHLPRHQPPHGFHDRGRIQPPPVFRHGHEPRHQLPPGFRR